MVSKLAHFPLFSMDVDLCFSYLFPKFWEINRKSKVNVMHSATVVKMTSTYHIILRWTFAQGYGIGEANRKAV